MPKAEIGEEEYEDGEQKSIRAEEQKSGVPRRKRGQQTKTAGAVASSDSGTSPLPGTCCKATCTCSVSKDSAIAFHCQLNNSVRSPLLPRDSASSLKQRILCAEIISRKVGSSQSDSELRVASLTSSKLCRIDASKFLMFILTSLERRIYVQ